MCDVKAVVFDIGATLVTGPPIAPNKVIASLVDNVTSAEVASLIMTTPLETAEEVCNLLRSHFGPLAKDVAERITELWKAQHRAAQEIEGATETVLTLKARGLKIGLLSDIWTPYYRSVERAIPCVINAAEAIVTSFQTGWRKPDPANFLRVLDDLGVEPPETVMVGDTYEHDILPALRLGMHAIWVLCRPDRESESIVRILNSQLPPPTVTVQSIDQVAQVDILQQGKLSAKASGA
ncbi:MAG: HAD family hydrolase [Armatimonadetes bacterium]|nr:HAD family hydrolase [Armatimonadota bacterium]